MVVNYFNWVFCDVGCFFFFGLESDGGVDCVQANVSNDESAAWPVANPVVTCASVSDAGFPSNFVADPFLFIQVIIIIEIAILIGSCCHPCSFIPSSCIYLVFLILCSSCFYFTFLFLLCLHFGPAKSCLFFYSLFCLPTQFLDSVMNLSG